MKLTKLAFLLFVFVAATTLLSSCTKKTDISEQYVNDPGRGYFPLKVGHFVTYNVDSTIYDNFSGTTRSAKYQMRYIIADTFLDDANRMSYRIEVFIRKNAGEAWVPSGVNYATQTAGHLEYQESNLRFVKLVYPISDGITWNGNSMIATDDPDLQYYAGWNYKYQNTDQAFVYDTAGFDKTVVVNEINDTLNNPVLYPTAYAYKTFSKEVYSIGIGLVYREFTHWVYDPNVGTGKSGFSVKLLAIDHN